MNKEFVKKIIGKKGTEIARSIKNSPKPKVVIIKKNEKNFTVIGKSRSEFWKSVQDGKWEPKTFKILDFFLDKKHSYIDIGSWIGPTVLYGSQLSKHCYAVEPDPSARKELTNNINLNEQLSHKISLSGTCISDTNGTTKLYSKSDLLYVEGTSGSSILENSTGNFWIVKTMTFDKFTRTFGIKDCNFIKMDVEGAEFTILPTMKNYLEKNTPTFLIEFHPMFVKNYLEELKKIMPILKIYSHSYNEEFKIIDLDSLCDIDTSKTFRIILSNKNLE